MRKTQRQVLSAGSTVKELHKLIADYHIPLSATLVGWGDGDITIAWMREETAEEAQQRKLAEAQSALRHERRDGNFTWD